MPSQYTRHICRARNRFSPAAALWQHFVAPLSTSHNQRFPSAALEATQQHDENNIDRATVSQIASDGFQKGGFGTTQSQELEKTDSSIKETEKSNGIGEGEQQHGKKRPRNTGVSYSNKDSSSTSKVRRLPTALSAAQRHPGVIPLLRAPTEDYKGIVVEPRKGYDPMVESMLPWSIPKFRWDHVGMKRLAREIDRFYEYMLPTRFEMIARKQLVAQVRNHVRAALPQRELDLFGSERTGLAWALSDIDLRLTSGSPNVDPTRDELPPTRAERLKAVSMLRWLFERHLRRNRDYMLSSMRQSRYPLIALQDKKSGLDVQIVLANDTSNSRNLMQGYMDEIPYLRKLFFLVRNMFEVRGLDDVFRGGFGSYSLFMMLVASIKHAPRPPTDAADGLLQFLEFYSTFDTYTKGISIEPAYIFDKASEAVIDFHTRMKLENGEIAPLPAYMLTLRDPADENNDLGRKGVAIKHVQATFQQLLTDLKSDIEHNSRGSLLKRVVGQSYRMYRSRRKKLDTYGQRVNDEVHALAAQQAKELQRGALAGKDPETIKLEKQARRDKLEEERRLSEYNQLALETKENTEAGQES